MLSLKEEAKKQTIIKLEDGQDKKEFLEWYIEEGGVANDGRHNINELDKEYISLGLFFGVIYWSMLDYTPNSYITWKDFKEDKGNILTEIKWDGKNRAENEHIIICNVLDYIWIQFSPFQSIEEAVDYEFRVGGERHSETTLNEINKIFAIYGYKIVIEEPKYKININGEYTEKEVKKLEELGIKFKKEKI